MGLLCVLCSRHVASSKSCDKHNSEICIKQPIKASAEGGKKKVAA